MKIQNNLTIPITGDDKTIDQLCKELADEAAVMKESDNVSISDLPKYVASKEFQKLYNNCMTFDADGHILGMTLFKRRK